MQNYILFKFSSFLSKVKDIRVKTDVWKICLHNFLNYKLNLKKKIQSISD